MKNKQTNFNRRAFLKTVGTGAAVSTLPFITSSSLITKDKGKKIDKLLKTGDVILFQGDSITDAGRDRTNVSPNNSKSLGQGYSFLIASELLKKFPEKQLSIHNRGISGNKVYQLAERWEKDCLEIKPDVLSILIGVNDYWHMRNGKYDGTTDVYRNDFRSLLEQTKEKLPETKLIICEPFILPGTRAVDETWIAPFREYQLIASAIADEFNATWVPFQTAFNRAAKLVPATYWTGDGVHPSMAGAQLMADSWLDAL